MPVLKPFLLLIAFIITANTSIAQKMYVGTPSQVFVAMTADAVTGSLNKFRTLVERKSTFEIKLNATRTKYWSQFEVGGISKTVEEEYAALLREKDLYYAYVTLMDRIYSIDPKLAEQDKGLVHIVDELSGGKFDGGIDRYAKKEFDKWMSSIVAQWQRERVSIVDVISLAAIMTSYTKEYEQYVAKRNMAEYWFRNNNSPFKKEGIAFLKGFLIFSKNAASINEANAIIKDLKLYNTEAQIINGANQYKASKARDLYKIPFQYEYDRKQQLAYLYEYIGHNNAKFYPLVLIMNEYHLPLKKCKEIHENRVSRYGSSAVSAAIAKNKECFRIDYDCVAAALDERSTRYKDFKMLASKEMDKAKTKSIFYDIIRTECKGADPISTYKEIIQYVNENTLLSATYIYSEYGKSIFPKKSGQVNGSTHLFNIIKGIAWVNKDYKTIAAHTLSFNSSKGCWQERLAEGNKELKVLINENGEEKTLSIVSDYLKNYPKVRFVTDYTKPSYLLKQYRLLNKKDSEGLASNIANNKSLATTSKLENSHVLKQSIAGFDINTMHTLILNNSKLKVYFKGLVAENVPYLIIELNNNEPIDVFQSDIEDMIFPLLKKTNPNIKLCVYDVIVKNCLVLSFAEYRIDQGKPKHSGLDTSLDKFDMTKKQSPSTLYGKELLRKNTSAGFALYEIPYYYSIEKPKEWKQVSYKTYYSFPYSYFNSYAGLEGSDLEASVKKLISTLKDAKVEKVTIDGIEYYIVDAITGSYKYIGKFTRGFAENCQGIFFRFKQEDYQKEKHNIDRILKSYKLSKQSIMCQQGG